MYEKCQEEESQPEAKGQVDHRLEDDKAADNIVGLVEWDKSSPRPYLQPSFNESESYIP